MNITTDIHITRLLQLTDSAFPVGSFAFSCGLESAVASGIVHNIATLKQFTRTNAIQAAFCDGIAAIQAHRSTLNRDFNGIIEADTSLIRIKMNDESRVMLSRMGRKLMELGNSIITHPILNKFLDEIKYGHTAGTYPVSQGVIFAILDIKEHELFYSHQYGVINMVLNAALRCVKVSHIDTQKILFELMSDVPALYNEVKEYNLYEMHAFCPELDIMASLHEKGRQRMFMN